MHNKSLLITAAALLAFLPLPSHAQWRTPWSYEGEKGPSHWSALDPDYALCNVGKTQSPVDIGTAVKADLPPLRFAYRQGRLTIINNGYTAVRVDYPPGNGNFLFVGGERYELTQFHFHHPSEDRINGKAFDMVLHLMHQSAGGKVVGVAVPLRIGSANPLIDRLWRFMPPHPGNAHSIPGIVLDPSALIPADRAYYRYQGSLTAPPCTEGVTWFVLKTPMEVSEAEIAAFARLYPHDVRPVQPLNGRLVEESR